MKGLVETVSYNYLKLLQMQPFQQEPAFGNHSAQTFQLRDDSDTHVSRDYLLSSLFFLVFFIHLIAQDHRVNRLFDGNELTGPIPETLGLVQTLEVL